MASPTRERTRPTGSSSGVDQPRRSRRGSSERRQAILAAISEHNGRKCGGTMTSSVDDVYKMHGIFRHDALLTPIY